MPYRLPSKQCRNSNWARDRDLADQRWWHMAQKWGQLTLRLKSAVGTQGPLESHTLLSLIRSGSNSDNHNHNHNRTHNHNHNQQPTTNNQQPTTKSQQPTTNDRQQTVTNKQQTANSKERRSSVGA